MYFFTLSLGVIFTVIGFIGCLIPIIPGPPLNYLGLIILQIIIQPSPFTVPFLITFGIITVSLMILDYIAPILGARMYGATKFGIIGSIIGLFTGLIFFPPFGVLLGLFCGTVIGEIIGAHNYQTALKAGFGSFITSVIMILVKGCASLVMIWYFVRALMTAYA